MGSSNRSLPKLDPAYLQRILQRGVAPLGNKPLHVDQHGRVRLYCTRNFERGCVVLRVRVQSAPQERTAGGPLVVKTSWPVVLIVTEVCPPEAYCPILDSLVDMVRLQYPDRQFVVQKKYPGQLAV